MNESTASASTLVDLFTHPSRYSRTRAQRRTWVGALTLILIGHLLAVVAWAAKVDPAAAMRRQLESINSLFKLGATDQFLDRAAEQASLGSSFIFNSAAGLLLGLIASIFLLSLMILFLAKCGGAKEEVKFKDTWSTSITQAFAILPSTMLSGFACLFNNFNDSPSPLSCSPTNLSYYVSTTEPASRGLLSVIDPFYIISYLVLYFCLKNSLGFKPWSCWVILISAAALGIPLRFFNGML